MLTASASVMASTSSQLSHDRQINTSLVAHASAIDFGVKVAK